MGNWNSGRPRIRPYLGLFQWFDVSKVAHLRDGDRVLITWNSGATIGVHGIAGGIELHFTCDGEPIFQSVPVDRLPCNFGGTRPMLRCPHCYRRRRRLYLCRRQFVCRTCTRARYWTQTCSVDARLTLRIRQLQKRLAPDDDPNDYVIDWVPRRPRGMRRATYRRVVCQLESLVDKRDAYLEPGMLRALARIARLAQDDELADMLSRRT